MYYSFLFPWCLIFSHLTIPSLIQDNLNWHILTNFFRGTASERTTGTFYKNVNRGDLLLRLSINTTYASMKLFISL